MPEVAGQAEWIPVALGADIEKGSAAPAVVAGTEVAIWRDGSGAVHVWQDRCPHRGMRLSFGFVRGDELSCLYHGWRYGADGAVRYIPAHPDLTPPKTICVNAYPCIEQGGLVWMHQDGSDAAAALALDEGAIPVRSIAIDARADGVSAMLGREDGAMTLAPGLVSLPLPGAGSGSARLIAALQPAAEGRTMVHLLVAPDERDDPVNLRMLASRWGERFRRSCAAASRVNSEGVAA